MKSAADRGARPAIAGIGAASRIAEQREMARIRRGNASIQDCGLQPLCQPCASLHFTARPLPYARYRTVWLNLMIASADFCSPKTLVGSTATIRQSAYTAQRALRVVVVDDNYDANVGLSRVLEKSGFEVAGRAYDGLSGFEVIQSTAPDVAILDISMPALDGFGLARRVRKEIGSPPRLIALTGFGDEYSKAEALQVGFDAYFLKPADWPALKALLLNYGSELRGAG